MHRYVFTVSTCDSAGVVSGDLGAVCINVSTGTGTGSVSQDTNDLSAIMAFWNNYMDTADFNSFVFTAPPYFSTLPQATIEAMRALVPVTTPLPDIESSTYLKITNANGQYGISESPISPNFSYVDRWVLYNADGTLVGSYISSSYALPLSNYSTFYFLIADDNNYSNNSLRLGRQDYRYYSPYYSYRSVSNIRSADAYIAWLQGLSEEPAGPQDPYSPGGDTGDDDSEGEGGTGDFDGTTDPIDFPDLPTVSAVDTKFITIFNPSKAQLTSLAEYMWSPLFDVDTLKKLWADPMDCILGLTMVPFSVPNGGTGTVAIGNISTGISMTKAGSQYVAINCGSINVKEFWGGYLDYDPYTKFQIYLPYVGIKPLLADEIMGKSIHVKYHCDILTGACNCFVKCGGSVLYSFNGQCSTQIPISGNDWRNTISAAINIAGQAAGMYVTGGATAPMAISSIAQSAVNGLKQTVEKSGSLSGTGGMLAIQKPYLIATRPKQAVPKNQNKFTGYPAFITRTLSSCSGYTEVYSCHLENIPCTSDELNEIENLLKSGVIL